MNNSPIQRLTFSVLAILLSTTFILVVAEIVLRVLEKKAISASLDFGDTIGGGLKEGGLLKSNLNNYVIDSVGKKVKWITNSGGFRNRNEFSKIKPKNTTRIMALGDSFMAGYRMGQEELLPYLWENWLNKNYGKYQVSVSMIGSPKTGLDYLLKYGLSYNPDLVLLGITLGNDIWQTSDLNFYNELIPESCLIEKSSLEKTLWAGNFFYSHLRLVELFHNQPRAIINSDTKYLKARLRPRRFDTIHGIGFFLKDLSTETEEMWSVFFNKLLKYQNLLKKKNIKFSLAIFSQRYQVQPNDWELAVYEYGLKKACFDLMLPNKKIKTFCGANDISCIDPTLEMKVDYINNKRSMFGPKGDMHWNKEGNFQYFAHSKKWLVNTLKRETELSTVTAE
tara:strand:+ start:40 stop:1221 length:1182 start_codon:yes stop_codon:yes gene_type:complete